LLQNNKIIYFKIDKNARDYLNYLLSFGRRLKIEKSNPFRGTTHTTAVASGAIGSHATILIKSGEF
jgi:hypothetical protein